ncbi:hypothetical protein GCM10028796_44850 [Ramlibacter monticola]|uniref:Uncharacterized protein n=1 Tax=Ramlibacter monticola TaxID=1926872 RepID=A0A936Z3Q1_9BURK|nr:hypothetical protein [Ramlibacter monticola]MBL0393082.1 hypothetical protein [Ramlibacter monticola]
MPAVPSHAAEAARYALLRRLAPSFRHHLVVNLQPIGMIYEVMDRRLRASAPDLAHVQDSANKINGFAKAALNSCVDVIGWLAPDDTATVSVHDAVRECAALLATSLSFRGYALRNEVPELQGVVRRAGMRTLLTGALLHCTDHLPAPSDLVLTAASEGDAVRLAVDVRGNQGENSFRGEANYRPLEWEDLEALAAADGVQLARQEERIELRLPWVAATG